MIYVSDHAGQNVLLQTWMTHGVGVRHITLLCNIHAVDNKAQATLFGQSHCVTNTDKQKKKKTIGLQCPPNVIELRLPHCFDRDGHAQFAHLHRLVHLGSNATRNGNVVRLPFGHVMLTLAMLVECDENFL